ncbi:hypothetical protein V6N13_042269 [Hibiscus sabdariffa]
MEKIVAVGFNLDKKGKSTSILSPNDGSHFRTRYFDTSSSLYPLSDQDSFPLFLQDDGSLIYVALFKIGLHHYSSFMMTRNLPCDKNVGRMNNPLPAWLE